MITEEQKQEADIVITTINAMLMYNEGIIVTYKFIVELAIQDRQSVLEEVKLMPLIVNKWYTIYKNERIQSVTNQIEYLKSKL
jgi:hypothetical protein